MTEQEWEQRYVSMLYHRLDAAREQTAARLNTARRTGGGTPQARWERDATASLYAERLTQLQAAENWLCFGRLDLHDGETRYIGRVGLFDDTDCDREPLLLGLAGAGGALVLPCDGAVQRGGQAASTHPDESAEGCRRRRRGPRPRQRGRARPGRCDR